MRGYYMQFSILDTGTPAGQISLLQFRNRPKRGCIITDLLNYLASDKLHIFMKKK